MFPANKRSEEAFEAYFSKAGLKEIVDFQVCCKFICLLSSLIIKLRQVIQISFSRYKEYKHSFEYKFYDVTFKYGFINIDFQGGANLSSHFYDRTYERIYSHIFSELRVNFIDCIYTVNVVVSGYFFIIFLLYHCN